jgi:hypothetical protein
LRALDSDNSACELAHVPSNHFFTTSFGIFDEPLSTWIGVVHKLERLTPCRITLIVLSVITVGSEPFKYHRCRRRGQRNCHVTMRLNGVPSDLSSTTSSSRSPKPRLRPFAVSLVAIFVCLFTLAWINEGHRHASNLANVITTCPDPARALKLPVDKPLQDIDSWHTQRRHLVSQDPRFNITLLRPLHRPCNVFAIDIHRTDAEECRKAESRTNMTTDAGILRYLKEELGPDTFMLRVSGGQRWTSEAARYRGDCRWRFDVTLSNGGDMWLELWHTYTVS